MSFSELLPSAMNAPLEAGGVVLMAGLLIQALRWLLGLPASEPAPVPVPVPVRRDTRPRRR
jgi:hypothetical protein